MIVRGLAFFHIPDKEETVQKLLLYVMELTRWNDRINLVGFRNAKGIIEELVYDAFFLSGHVGDSPKTLDLGSGSGILAIPLKILTPGMEMHSVDRSLKKIQFQRHIKRSLSLEGFFPVHGRIEEIGPLGVDSVVVKAFGSIPLILDVSRDHVRAGGRVFIVKGMREEGLKTRGFCLDGVHPYSLPGSGRKYRLFIYRKEEG